MKTTYAKSLEKRINRCIEVMKAFESEDLSVTVKEYQDAYDEYKVLVSDIFALTEIFLRNSL